MTISEVACAGPGAPGPPQYGISSAGGSTPSLNAQSHPGNGSNGQPFVANPFPQATMTATNFDDFTHMTNSSTPVRPHPPCLTCACMHPCFR